MYFLDNHYDMGFIHLRHEEKKENPKEESNAAGHILVTHALVTNTSINALYPRLPSSNPNSYSFPAMPIFDGVRHWLTESLPHDRKVLNSNYLNLNGGEKADSIDHATHIITNTSQFEGWRRVEDGEINAVVVTVRLITLYDGVLNRRSCRF
jgi:hypothetical protein